MSRHSYDVLGVVIITLYIIYLLIIIKGNKRIYVNRWDRLDYTRTVTNNKNYDFYSCAFYSEYSLHMYGWLFPITEDIGNHCLIPDVYYKQLDTRFEVKLLTFIVGGFGI